MGHIGYKVGQLGAMPRHGLPAIGGNKTKGLKGKIVNKILHDDRPKERVPRSVLVKYQKEPK
jgi:hypothetical protein